MQLSTKLDDVSKKWDKTRNKFTESVVTRIVTITSAEENKFNKSVVECPVKVTIIGKKEKPWLNRCPL